MGRYSYECHTKKIVLLKDNGEYISQSNDSGGEQEWNTWKEKEKEWSNWEKNERKLNFWGHATLFSKRRGGKEGALHKVTPVLSKWDFVC